jgi:hypothetical protein
LLSYLASGIQFTFCGLYYKLIAIVNDDSSVISKGHSLLIDDARVVIYDCTMFIIQAAGLLISYQFSA